MKFGCITDHFVDSALWDFLSLKLHFWLICDSERFEFEGLCDRGDSLFLFAWFTLLLLWLYFLILPHMSIINVVNSSRKCSWGFHLLIRKFDQRWSKSDRLLLKFSNSPLIFKKLIEYFSKMWILFEHLPQLPALRIGIIMLFILIRCLDLICNLYKLQIVLFLIIILLVLL